MEKERFRKIQLQKRPTKHISVNDALTVDLFSMTDKEYRQVLSGNERKFREAETKKHGIVESRYWLEILDDERVKISNPLEEFDRDILDACITEQTSGGECTTTSRIWRAITGNPEAEPTPSLKKEIAERVDRLACTRIVVDISKAHKAGIYRQDTKLKLKSFLLPCEIAETYVNGRFVESAIHFNGESPLVKLARARSGKKKKSAQILTYENTLLDVTSQRNTPTTTAITNYLLRRIEAAKQHTNLKRCILFDTLLARCGLTEATWRQRQETRKTIETVMKSFVEKEEIKSFEFIKEHGQFVKITFEF